MSFRLRFWLFPLTPLQPNPSGCSSVSLLYLVRIANRGSGWVCPVTWKNTLQDSATLDPQHKCCLVARCQFRLGLIRWISLYRMIQLDDSPTLLPWRWRSSASGGQRVCRRTQAIPLLISTFAETNRKWRVLIPRSRRH